MKKAQMFLQHYGIPTELIDFSSDPEIALFFASVENPDQLGIICSMEIERAREFGDVISLSDYALYPDLTLERPKKQKAFALRHYPGSPSDLKATEARNRFGIRWYAFRKNDCEAYVEKHKHVLQIDNDKVALYVMTYAADFGLSTWQPADVGITVLRRILSQMSL